MYIYRIYIRQFRKTPDDPILVLDNQQNSGAIIPPEYFATRASGQHLSLRRRTRHFRSNILRIDARFVNLIKWLGENRINVLLSGENRADGYAVYKIRENAFHGGTRNFPQRMDFYSM